MRIPFEKYEGLGNDFIVVGDGVPLNAAQARYLCDRHRGIGADGVLVVNGPEEARPSMVVWNADGSRSEMCGNGLRCVAWHHVRHGGAEDVVWDTDAGPHHCVTAPSSDGVADVEVAMVPPTFASEAIPTCAGKPLIDTPVALPADASGPEITLQLTAVGMGNPHAVIFGHSEARRVLGPRVQQLALFPEGVNVGFAEPMAGGFVLHVLERGAGWTQACGTGACAAAAAAVATGRAEQGTPLIIRLPGGDLSVRIDGEGDPARMQGPARFVFQGEVTLPLG